MANFTVPLQMAQAVTVTLLDNQNSGAQFGGAITAANNAAFTAGNEFRIILAGAASGFGEKSLTGNQTIKWHFDSNTNELTSVSGTDIAPAASMQPDVATGFTGAASGLFQNTSLFGFDLGFLAPIGAAGLNGAATIAATAGTNNWLISFPALESHWVGADSIQIYGPSSGGISFVCNDIDGTISHCSSDHLILGTEDLAGFAGQYLQFDFDITVSSIPLPASVWLFGSGLIGLLGLAKRKHSKLVIQK